MIVEHGYYGRMVMVERKTKEFQNKMNIEKPISLPAARKEQVLLMRVY